MVIGIDPEGEGHANGLLPFPDLVDRFGDREVLIGQGFARKHGIQEGEELAVVGQDLDGAIANDLYVVSAVVPSPVEVVNNMGIVMTIEDAEELLRMPNQAHEIVVHVDSPERVDATLAQIRTLPLLDDAEVLPWYDIVPQFVSMIKLIDYYALVVLFIVCIAALAGIANTMLMSTFERIHEFGMLLSLGCSPGRLARIVTLEALLIGVIGVGIGSVLGLGWVALTSESGIDYAALGGNQSTYEVAYQGLHLTSRVVPRLYYSDIIAALVAVLCTSLVSVIWPMLRVVRLEPMEAMRS
jgi:ABC-type lipoprotein release transport system permease subunit